MTSAPILIVHDDADVAELIRRTLQRAGLTEIVTAPDGEQGLEAALRLLPRLVIADVHMPGLDGFQLLQVLRRGSAPAAGIPVILVSSSFRDPAAARLAGDLGASEYVESPCEGDHLIEAVLRVLNAPPDVTPGPAKSNCAAARVLVVEDEPDVAAVVQATLRRRGYYTDTVPTAKAAFEELSRGRWDLVLLDYNLPDGNGLELLRRLRAAGSGVAAVALSAHVDLELGVEFMRAGADDVLHKPFEPTVILGAVGRALERRALSIRASQFRARLDAVRQSEARCRSLVELSRDVICRLDAEGRIRECSPATPYLVGRRQEELLGQPLQDWITPESAARLRGALVLNPGDTEIELDLRGADGPIPLSVRVQPLREGDVVVGHWLVGRDLRRQRRLSRELAESEKRASVSRLIGGISHEFSGVIGALHGFVSLHRSGVQVDSEALDEMQGAASQAADLLTTIRLLAWADGPRRDLDAAALTRGLLAAQEPLFERAGVRLELDAPAELPPVRARASSLLRAITELCSNARHAAAEAPSGGAVKITVRPSSDGELVWEISDNGAGMQPDEVRQAFEPFYTTKGALGGSIVEGKTAGTGLGLSVARAIAHTHGGELELRCSDDGCTARLAIPISGSPDQPTQGPNPVPAMLPG